MNGQPGTTHGLSGATCAANVAALYVQTNGCYFGLPDVDPWDAKRDARLYDGPHPVVAHPPCERWGRYWGGSPTQYPRLVLGDDAGCFEAALAAVRKWGGVLEHPEGSHAWRKFNLDLPGYTGGWSRADWTEGFDGWTCCVEQGAYGHKARKKTWLYAHGVELPSLEWGRAEGDFAPMDAGFHGADERRRWRETGAANPYIARSVGSAQRLTKRQRAASPEPFRDLLLSIARSARSEISEAA